MQKMPWRFSLAFLLVIGPLWLASILIGAFSSQKISWLIITAIWVGLGSVIWLWSFLPESRKEQKQLSIYQDAINQNQVVVVRIASELMVALEEEEDEGACYAFQLPGERIIFVSGQDLYPTARFPNSDFSLVHILTGEGHLLERFITKHGRKLKPLRTLSAKAKSRLRVPGHLETIQGRLEDLEHLLAIPER